MAAVLSFQNPSLSDERLEQFWPVRSVSKFQIPNFQFSMFIKIYFIRKNCLNSAKNCDENLIVDATQDYF